MYVCVCVVQYPSVIISASLSSQPAQHQRTITYTTLTFSHFFSICANHKTEVAAERAEKMRAALQPSSILKDLNEFDGLKRYLRLNQISWGIEFGARLIFVNFPLYVLAKSPEIDRMCCMILAYFFFQVRRTPLCA